MIGQTFLASLSMVPPLIWDMTTPVVGHGRLVRTIQQAFLDVIQDDFIVGRILQNGDRDAGTDLGEVGRHLHRLIFKICVYRRSSAVRLDNHPGSRGLLRLRRLVGRGGPARPLAETDLAVAGAIGGAGAGTGWCRSGAGSLRDHRTDDLIAKARRLQCNQTISTGVIGFPPDFGWPEQSRRLPGLRCAFWRYYRCSKLAGPCTHSRAHSQNRDYP